jgi:CheY-like chemotaxis protein
MVYGVMQRHDGSIDIMSEPGKGTIMRLVFPAAPAAASAPPVLAAPPRLPPMRILCIDDEPLLREMLKHLLEQGGHHVEVADGGQAGIDRFRAARNGRSFEIVITDLGMPHLDGRQVAALIKRDSPHTPVIMLTGWGTIMKDEGDVPAHVDAVLCKPPKVHELFEVLGSITKTPPSHAEAVPAAKAA